MKNEPNYKSNNVFSWGQNVLKWFKSERRKCSRKDEKILVFYSKIDENGQYFINDSSKMLVGVTINSSLTGICVRLGQPILEGMILGMTLKYQNPKLDVFSIGKVVWSCAFPFDPSCKEGRYLMGVELELIGKQGNLMVSA